MAAPKGLLKAFITDSNGFQFKSDRANKPDRYGCTLLFLDGGEFYDEWDGTEDVEALIAHLDGLEINLELHCRLVAGKTTAVLCTPHIDDEVPGFLELDRYIFPHHITECWDGGCNPVDAAKEAAAYVETKKGDYWNEVEDEMMMGDAYYDSETPVPGDEFLKQKGWVIEKFSAPIVVRAKIEWKPFE